MMSHIDFAESAKKMTKDKKKKSVDVAVSMYYSFFRRYYRFAAVNFP